MNISVLMLRFHTCMKCKRSLQSFVRSAECIDGIVIVYHYPLSLGIHWLRLIRGSFGVPCAPTLSFILYHFFTTNSGSLPSLWSPARPVPEKRKKNVNKLERKKQKCTFYCRYKIHTSSNCTGLSPDVCSGFSKYCNTCASLSYISYKDFVFRYKKLMGNKRCSVFASCNFAKPLHFMRGPGHLAE